MASDRTTSRRAPTAGVRPAAKRSAAARRGAAAPAEPLREIAGTDRTDLRILRVLQTDGRITSFQAAVQARPEILECHLVAGGFDYLIKTRAADMDAYRDMLASVIWALPGVRETRTYAVMEEVKNTTALPL